MIFITTFGKLFAVDGRRLPLFLHPEEVPPPLRVLAAAGQAGRRGDQQGIINMAQKVTGFFYPILWKKSDMSIPQKNFRLRTRTTPFH